MYFTSMKVKYTMKKDKEFYHFFVDSIQELRKETGTSVTQLCADSHVSTRTFAKFTKKIPIKPECCYRLIAGSCKGATEQEFLQFWEAIGIDIYNRFSQ